MNGNLGSEENEGIEKEGKYVAEMSGGGNMTSG